MGALFDDMCFFWEFCALGVLIVSGYCFLVFDGFVCFCRS